MFEAVAEFHVPGPRTFRRGERVEDDDPAVAAYPDMFSRVVTTQPAVLVGAVEEATVNPGEVRKTGRRRKAVD